MLQLQQLGLPLGFRSNVLWWNDYLSNHYHKTHEKHYRGNHNNEEKYNKKVYK